MNAKQWLKLFTLASAIIMSLVVSINYLVDPFDIFHTKIFKYQFQRNERFVKIDYIEPNKDKYNGYMFGSSRMGTTEPSIIEKYIPNSKFYNLSISSANLYDYITNLKFFIKNRYPIKYLYMQIDVDIMNTYGYIESDYLRKPHPDVVGESLNLYYLKYLVGLFPFNIKGKILTNLSDDIKTNYVIQRGIWEKPVKERLMQEDCERVVKKIPDFHRENRRFIRYTIAEKNIKALKEIKQLCKEHNIKLYVFIMPHNKNLMDTFIIEDYLKYIKDIASVTDFYDFSGYNSITSNNCNYYEISHYRPLVAKLIAARIFHDKNVSIPNDFGIYVTKDNIDKHLEVLKKQAQIHDMARGVK